MKLISDREVELTDTEASYKAVFDMELDKGADIETALGRMIIEAGKNGYTLSMDFINWVGGIKRASG